jgi:hypothetical protein
VSVASLRWCADWSNKFTQAVYGGVVEPLEKIIARWWIMVKDRSDETLSV